MSSLKERGVEFLDVDVADAPMKNSISSGTDGVKLAWFFDSERNIINLAEVPGG